MHKYPTVTWSRPPEMECLIFFSFVERCACVDMGKTISCRCLMGRSSGWWSETRGGGNRFGIARWHAMTKGEKERGKSKGKIRESSQDRCTYIGKIYSLRKCEKQEQTKFYDLRRGITEDFQRLAKFQRTLSKSTKKNHRF